MSEKRKPTSGAWKPGESGNPAGRIKGVERLVREIIGDDFEALVQAQKRIAMGLPPEQAPMLEIKASDATRAFSELMDRGYGKAKQTLQIEPDAPEQVIDWSRVPLERRELLLAAMGEIELLTADAGDIEH